jgi:hypothetical protein
VATRIQRVLEKWFEGEDFTAGAERPEQLPAYRKWHVACLTRRLVLAIEGKSEAEAEAAYGDFLAAYDVD